jgi:hypothetical protein
VLLSPLEPNRCTMARTSVRELIRLSPLENHDYADTQKTREKPCFYRANTVLRRCNRARRMAKLPIWGAICAPKVTHYWRHGWGVPSRLGPDTQEPCATSGSTERGKRSMRWRAVADDALRHNEALAVAAASASRLDQTARAPVSSTRPVSEQV